MKISRFQVFSFTLPLTRPLTVRKEILEKRSGLIIELGNETGHLALGEVSPLPAFSLEDLTQTRQQLTRLRASVLKNEIPDNLETLSGGFEEWLAGFDLASSVRFGFETAVLGLVAAAKGVQLPELLCDNPSDVVIINGLLSGSRLEILEKAQRLMAQGYQAFKLKVGRGPLAEDIAMVREVRSLLGKKTVLRLDANRAWSMEQAIAFAAGLSDMPIDYLEEPVGSLELLVRLSKEPIMTLPLALDESLLDMDPDDLFRLPKIKAVILKPTLLGFEKAMQFARAAVRVGMTPVVSSAFESGVGMAALAQIACALNQEDVAAGLDTLDWFVEDLLLIPLSIENGRVAVPGLPNTSRALKGHLIQVADDA